jgi:capsular polysaccharide transport system ATP-binding protein
VTEAAVVLALRNVWKSYPLHDRHRWVLRGLNLEIEKGSAVGILGRNGAGKSTLVRLLAGVELPTHGIVQRDMSVSWPLGGAQGTQGSLTGADNVRFIARIYGLPVERTVQWVRNFVELGPYFDMPIATYSGGMRSRLVLTLSLLVDFECYLIDEGLATGDARFSERYGREIQARLSRSSLILVSHSPELVKRLCNRAAVLDQGVLTTYRNIDEALARYKRL